MSWQEELRRLDAQLTAGALTEAEHRRKRDEVLAEASSGGDTGDVGDSGDGTGTADSQPARGAGSPEAAGSATPHGTNTSANAPAGQTGPQSSDGPKWAAANPAAAAQLRASTDSTDVRSGGASPASSRSDSAQSPSTKPAPTPLSHAPSTARRAPAPLFVPHTPANGAGSFGSSGFSQASSSFGSGRSFASGSAFDSGETPSDHTSAASQASAYPDFSVPTKKRKRAWIVVPLVILVVLGGVIGGAWWLGTSGNDSAAPAPTSGSSADPDGGTAGTDDEVSLSDRLPELPGKPSPDNSTMSVDRARDLEFVTGADAESMRRFGVADLVYRASADGENGKQGHSLLVARTPSEQKAVGLQRAMNKTLVKEGFSNERLRDDTRFISFTGEQADGRVSIVWYASGSDAVGIGVSQPKSDDEQALIGRLEEMLTSVQEALPAS